MKEGGKGLQLAILTSCIYSIYYFLLHIIQFCIILYLNLAKVEVASSNLVSRSKLIKGNPYGFPSFLPRLSPKLSPSATNTSSQTAV